LNALPVKSLNGILYSHKFAKPFILKWLRSPIK
jgi:hypothetical protein